MGLCVVETALSIIVFAYVIQRAEEIVNDISLGDCHLKELGNLPVGQVYGYLARPLFPLEWLVCTGCAVWCAIWTGVSHSKRPSGVRAAVDDIVSINEGGINRLGRREITLFEVYDVITIG